MEARFLPIPNLLQLSRVTISSFFQVFKAKTTAPPWLSHPTSNPSAPSGFAFKICLEFHLICCRLYCCHPDQPPSSLPNWSLCTHPLSPYHLFSTEKREWFCWNVNESDMSLFCPSSMAFHLMQGKNQSSYNSLQGPAWLAILLPLWSHVHCSSTSRTGILAVPCTFQTGSHPSAIALAALSVWNASPLDFLMAYSLTPLRSFFDCQRLAEACLSHLFTVASHPCNWYAPPSVPTLVFYKAHICLIREWATILVCLGLSQFQHWKSPILGNPIVPGKLRWVVTPLIYYTFCLFIVGILTLQQYISLWQ